MAVQTNLGEYITGAYYAYILKANPVIYNQPIFLSVPEKDIQRGFDLTPWTLEELERWADGTDIHRSELDVVGIVDGGIYVAQCTESDPENREPEVIMKKARAAVLYRKVNYPNVPLTIEFWAPTFAKRILEVQDEIRKSCQDLVKRISHDQIADASEEEPAVVGPNSSAFDPLGDRVDLCFIGGDVYLERLRELTEAAKQERAAKLWNPFYRSLQLLNRAGVILDFDKEEKKAQEVQDD